MARPRCPAAPSQDSPFAPRPRGSSSVLGGQQPSVRLPVTGRRPCTASPRSNRPAESDGAAMPTLSAWITVAPRPVDVFVGEHQAGSTERDALGAVGQPNSRSHRVMATVYRPRLVPGIDGRSGRCGRDDGRTALLTRCCSPVQRQIKHRYRDVIPKSSDRRNTGQRLANRPPLSAGRAVARPGSGGAVFSVGRPWAAVWDGLG